LNESFNSLVWSITPKSTLSEKTIVDIAYNLAISIFNDFTSTLKVKQVLNLTIDPNCFNFCVKSDVVSNSERSFIEKAKKFFRSSRKERDKENLNLEG